MILLNRLLSLLSVSKERDGRAQTAPDSLPSELDFFKYSQSTQPKRKADEGIKMSSRKRRKVADGEEERASSSEDEGSDGEREEETGHTLGQRVTVKGRSAPESAHSFAKMKERYDIPGHVMANLEKFGFERPTGIQAYGCPILLEVSTNSSLLVAAVYSTSSETRSRSHISHGHWKDPIISSTYHVCSSCTFVQRRDPGSTWSSGHHSRPNERACTPDS